jgi:hypothetical protein
MRRVGWTGTLGLRFEGLKLRFVVYTLFVRFFAYTLSAAYIATALYRPF